MKSTAAATFVVAQIETFAASHIGDIYRRSLFVTKTVTFVSHQNVCVTRRVTTLHMWVTLCGGSRTRSPPPGACCRSSRTLGSRGLCMPGVSGVVGRADTPAKIIFLCASSNPCFTRTFHVFPQILSQSQSCSTST